MALGDTLYRLLEVGNPPASPIKLWERKAYDLR